jgi:hypothetical protein
MITQALPSPALSELPHLDRDGDLHVVAAVFVVGGLWLLWWFALDLSVTVAVGFVALAGVAAETGVVILIIWITR